MPEGDTVWNTARCSSARSRGGELTASDFRVPQLATTRPRRLDGASSRRSRGKHLLLRLRDARPAPTARCTRTCGWTARGGRTRRASAGRPARAPDPGGAAYRGRTSRSATTCTSWRWSRPPRSGRWSATSARTCSAPTGTRTRRSGGCAAKPDATIAEALLDQRNLAGIGNLYKAETLFLRGVWPWTPVRRRGRPGRDWSRWPTSLLASQPGPLDADARPARCATRRDHLRVRPPRAALPPLRHRDPEEAEQDERVTYWCPRCQPNPTIGA